MKNRKKAIIIVGILLFIALITGFTVNIVNEQIEKENYYQEIIKCIDENDYITALQIVNKIPNYKDVETLNSIAAAFYAYQVRNYYYTNRHLEDIPKDYNGKYKEELDRLRKTAKILLEREYAEPIITTTTTTTRDNDYYDLKPKKSRKKKDSYNANEYAHEDDFYYDNYDDFYDYEDAEDYYDDYGDY